jgi:radical SAM protein with 4Fe4S-binding SPASM domain
VRLTPSEIVELDLLDPGRVKEWGEFSRDFIRPQQPSGREDEVYHCGGGINSFAIDPAGKMSICVLSRQDEFDLRSASVAEGWDHFLHKVRLKKITRVTKCTACQLKSVCGMCPANAELEAGDPEKPVEFLCHVAHLRALTMGWPVPAHGECEFCPGGCRHEEVVQSAERLSERRQGTQRPRRVLLPVVSQERQADSAGCAGGGCGSCAAY